VRWSGSLIQIWVGFLVASQLLRQPHVGRSAAGRSAPPRHHSPLTFVQGSLSGTRAPHRAPWLAGLHRTADGTLAGLGLCMVALSVLTLHWQNQWGRSYQHLESAQTLEHRLQESSAILEQHYLGSVRKPGWLVPTSSDKIIYLPPPQTASQQSTPNPLPDLHLRWVPAGY
jgi:hypothetical protein